MSFIKQPFEIEVFPLVKVLLYGQPGIGKTSLALSSPRPLLLDFDHGVHRIDPRHQTPTVQVKSWADIDSVLNEDLSGFSTLVVDTAGKMLDFMSAFLMRENPKLKNAAGALTLQGFGARKALFIQFLGRASMLGKHLVFVAHEKEEKDDEQKIVRPEIGGSSAGDLIKELDLVGYMQAIGQTRTISFDPCEKFYAKNTCNLDSRITIPDIRDGNKNNFLSLIFDQYIKNLESRKELGDQYSALIERIIAAIPTVKDAETANNFAAQMIIHEAIWDSKLQAGIRLRDKAKELGLVLNRETKLYGDAPKGANKAVSDVPTEKQAIIPPAPETAEIAPNTAPPEEIPAEVITGLPEGDIQAGVIDTDTRETAIKFNAPSLF